MKMKTIDVNTFKKAGFAVACIILSGMTHAEQKINHTVISGFDCAEQFLPSVHTLGRGTDFPRFLVEDIENELRRQTPGTVLLSVSCIKEPSVTGKALSIETSNGIQQTMTEVDATFHLNIEFQSTMMKLSSKVDHQYVVTDMNTDSPKLVQKFQLK